MLYVACGTTPPAGSPDVGPRRDASDTATLDGGGEADSGVDSGNAMDAGDTSNGDTGTDAGDAPNDDASGDASIQDTGDASTHDASTHDANNLTLADTGAVIVPDVGILGCTPSTHLTGDPLGSPYDWTGCGGLEALGSASNWTYNLLVADDGVGFFHAPSIASGTTGQPIVGTFLLPPPSVAAPFAVVCSGTTSTVDIDAGGNVSGFALRNTTTLHSSGNSASGGLIITMGSSTVLSGDVGTHHFASAADSTYGIYDALGANMTMSIGTTELSLMVERAGNSIILGVVQVASGSTTDVYTFSSGTATATTVTLPSTLSFLGACDGSSAGTQSLTGTVTH